MKHTPRRTGIEEVWYGDSTAAKAIRLALAPLSLVFGAGVAARGFLHDSGYVVEERAAVPVVSVGGLRVGGAGKTPFVLWLAARLSAQGRRPCIVTRGYGGQAGVAPFLVTVESLGRSAPAQGAGSDPAALAAALARAGDEAVLLALRSGCPVAVGRDRAAACRYAMQELGRGREVPDVFLLDDGFQHRALARDVDIALVSGTEGAERLLPAGPLRETVAALERADAVVTMGQGSAAAGRSVSRPERSSGMLSGKSGSLALRAVARPVCLVAAVTDARGESLEMLAGRRVVAVAGIARPDRFLANLEEAGATIMKAVLRRDHHRYDDGDRGEIDVSAASADLVVTTEKDLVKLAGTSASTPFRALPMLRALRIEVEVAEARALLERISSSSGEREGGLPQA